MKSSTQSRQPKNNFWTPTRLTFTFIVLALLAAFGASSCNPSADVAQTDVDAPKSNVNALAKRTASAPPPLPPAKNAAPAEALVALPAELLKTELRSLDGESFKLADYAGKVVVVNLWATWCGPCRLEIPHLVELRKDLKAGDLEIIGLTTEGNDPDEEVVNDFVRRLEINYRIGYAPGEFVATMSRGRNSIPQSFVITRDGRLFKHFVGFNPQVTPLKLREAVQQLVNEKSGA